VRIGIDVGEPIADSNDLFGATVQMAARLCQLAEPDAILVSRAVKDRVQDSRYLTGMGAHHLKGFPQPVDVYGVEWR
jgi:class 3 adenylate cyclase